MFKNTIGSVSALVLVAAPIAATAKDKDPIKVSSAKTFAGLQQVVIGSFNIAFVHEKTDKAFSGRGTAFGGSSIAKSKLDGLTPAEFQAVADAAYADFTAKLTAAGYTIADRAAYSAFPDMASQRMVASGAEGTVQADKNEKAKAVFYAPSAFGPTPIVAGSITGGTFGAFGQFGSAIARNKFAIATKTPVVDVRYVIDYADAKFRGGAFSFGSSVKLTAQLAVVETLSTITVTDTRGMLGTMMLQEAVAVDGDFGELRNTTTGGQRAEQALGNVIGMLGGIGTQSRKFFTFTAIADAYRGGATDAAARTNTTMVTRMASLR
jgi:hypothetical protein